MIRHAQARQADVSLVAADGWATLTVSDDGAGLPDGASSSGSGIAGMRERALLVDGRLDVSPGEQGGTVVRLRVPLGDAG